MSGAEVGANPVSEFDVTRPELYRDRTWAEPFRKLREEAPLYFCRESRFGPFWSASSYRHIVEIESKPEQFSSMIGGVTLRDFLDGDARTMGFIAADRPRHSAQRNACTPAFTHSAMLRMAEETRQRITTLFDTLPIGETFDWVEKVAIEITVQTLAIFLGFPLNERHKLTFWTDWISDIEAANDADRKHVRLQHIRDCGEHFRDLWSRKANEPPSSDLISIMMHSEGMSNLSDLEFLGNIILFVAGGNDTTRNSISAFAWGLEQFADERRRLEEDPALIPNAISEIIRWQTPISHMRRTATQDCELDGRQIGAGDKIALWYISGNYDESVFPEAERIILDRPNARRHLSFGYGVHRCLGARVAELQIAALMEEMAKRRLRVNVDGTPERISGCFVNGYRKMPVTLTHY